MYSVSPLWSSIVAQDGHRFEISVVVGESGRLITRAGEAITFGGTAILVSQGGADSGYTASRIISLTINQRQFPESYPSVGACLAAEMEVTMLRPAGEIPRMALVRPYVRVVNDTQQSEWIPQGIFYIDTRSYTKNDDGLNLMTLHCYDAMLMTEQDYPATSLTWPAADTDVVSEIAAALGVAVDPRTWDVMTDGYQISLPAGYSMRETLGNIAAMYCGNFVMNYDGQLLLVAINSQPAETNYLVDNFGFAITFGGDRILV